MHGGILLRENLLKFFHLFYHLPLTIRKDTYSEIYQNTESLNFKIKISDRAWFQVELSYTLYREVVTLIILVQISRQGTEHTHTFQ